MSTFSSFHPFVVFSYFAVIIFTTMFTANPVLLLIAILSGVLFYALIEKPAAFLKDGLFYLLLFLIVSITNPLFSHNGATPLFFMNGNAITLEAILSGLRIAVMLIGILYWFKSYSIIITSDKFLYLFGKVLPKLALVFSMAIRFIPLFRNQIRKVSNAQKAMGLYSKDNLPDKFKAGMRVFSVMVTWALENSIETGDSMKARGYELKNKSHYSLFKFTLRDAMLMASIVFLSGIVFFGVICGSMDFAFYPRVEVLKFGAFQYATSIAFGILAFIPFFIEIKEKIKWIYFKSQS